MRRFLEVFAIAICSIYLVIGAGVPVLARREKISSPTVSEMEKRFAVGSLAMVDSLPTSLNGIERQALIEEVTNIVSAFPTERIDPQLVHAFGGSLTAKEFVQTITIQGPQGVEEFLAQSPALSAGTSGSICRGTRDDKQSVGQLLFDPSLQVAVAERLKERSSEYRSLPKQIVVDVSKVWLRALGARCLLASLDQPTAMTTDLS